MVGFFLSSFNTTYQHSLSSKQRMQKTQDQMQWTKSMSAMREPRSRMRLCPQLLHRQLQGFGRVQVHVGPDCDLARSSRHAFRQYEQLTRGPRQPTNAHRSVSATTATDVGPKTLSQCRCEEEKPVRPEAANIQRTYQYRVQYGSG